MRAFARHSLALVTLLIPAFAAKAQSSEPWIEYEQRMNQDQRLTAYGPDLLGDSIDPASGQISFEHADIVLPGNSRLDVSLRRRVTQGYLYGEGVNAEFGNWQYVVPRIVAITRTAGWTGNRCSNSLSTSFPPIQRVGGYPGETLDNWQYSNGVMLEVPGMASQHMLQGGWTTAENWYFTCITLADGSQGFMGHAPNGNTYRFDKYINHAFRPLGVMMSSKSVGTPRSKSMLMATLVTDVNGNTVNYDYDASGRLMRIYSNDGREINLLYQNASWPKLVTQVNANPGGATRTWTYTYRNTWASKPYWEGGGSINIQSLGTVTQPDGRSWTLALDGMFAEPTPGECWTEAVLLGVTHPYGAVGTFWLTEARHRYSQYDMMQLLFDCPSGEPSPPPPQNPEWVIMQTDTMSVYSKRLEGPGTAPATWTFEYEYDNGPYGSSGSDPTNWTKVVQPDGSEITYFHRWQGGSLGGMLFRKETRRVPGVSPLEIIEHRQPATPTGTPSFVVEAATGFTFGALGSNVGTVKIRPDKVVIKRGPESAAESQFDTFTTDNDYDSSFSSPTYSFGNPTQVTETSSTAPGLSRVTVNTYLHYKTAPLWVIGLPDTVTRNGKLFDDYGYDALGRLTTHSRFGVLKYTYTYSTVASEVGAVASITDALSNVWTLSNWERGKPQTVGRPDGTTFTRVVDDNGWVTSETDGRSITTVFQYNTMGWLTFVDRVAPFADTSISYSGAGVPLQAIHTRGTQRLTVSYDEMLRATLVKTDATDGSVAAIYEATAYDIEGRVRYKSLPAFFAPTPPAPPAIGSPGVETFYDALGRVTLTKENISPFAQTVTEYLLGGVTRVTDPALEVVTTTSRAFGTPGRPEVRQVVDAMGGTTVMERDIFGNVLTLTQSGLRQGQPVSATRTFKYNDDLRVCRHSAPEFGDELFAYDARGLLAFSSRGEAPGTDCAAPSAGLRTAFTYDPRRRLTLTDFPSTTPDISVGYDAESNRLSVSRNGINWTYLYNELNLPTQEKLVIDTRTYQFDYGYNASGQLISRTRLGGTAITYAPDALGRPAKVSAGGIDYVHSVTYHPNGLVGAGTFHNGQVFLQDLDDHLRPEEVTVAKGATTAMSRIYGYDARSQLTSIDDFDNAEDRTFDYDPKGRLATATGPWGSGTFEYDDLDNLLGQTLGSRVITVSYADATNRVTSATDAGAPRAYGYDTRGNATTVAGMTFTYDFSNQPTSVSGAVTATYDYDGNLKRVKSQEGGKTVYSIYSTLGGSVIFRDEVTDARAVDYLGIGGLSVRLTNGADPEYTHADHLGSPIAATDELGAIKWRESYNPFGEARIKPAANANQTGFTGHIQDADSGLTYMQARYYDPVIGRFLSTDPIGYQDQINQYAYVGNDPVNKFDPSGTTSQCTNPYDLFGCYPTHELPGPDPWATGSPPKPFDAPAKRSTKSKQAGKADKAAIGAAIVKLEGLPWAKTADGAATIDLLKKMDAGGFIGFSDAIKSPNNGDYDRDTGKIRIGLHVGANHLPGRLAHEGTHALMNLRGVPRGLTNERAAFNAGYAVDSQLGLPDARSPSDQWILENYDFQ